MSMNWDCRREAVFSEMNISVFQATFETYEEPRYDRNAM
jgi:hypothetical protein